MNEMIKEINNLEHLIREIKQDWPKFENKTKPVIRFTGSKWRKIDTLLTIMGLNKESKFIDLFSGSAIVGVNAKSIFGCSVKINDYEKRVNPLKDSYIVQNGVSFAGLGKYFTKAASEHFSKRVQNGLWTKVEKFKEILSTCEIVSKDYKDVVIEKGSVVYADPPYYNIKDLYDNEVDHNELKKYFDKNKGHSTIFISYNNHEKIKEIYKDWFIYKIAFNHNVFSKHKKVYELIITNKPLKESFLKEKI